MIFRNRAYRFTFNPNISGRTWQVYVSKDGGNYETFNGSVTPINQGAYSVYATAGDMDGNHISIMFVETNNPPLMADPLVHEASIVTEDPLTYESAQYLNSLDDVLSTIGNDSNVGEGTEVWLYTMYADELLTTPLEGCLVVMSKDEEGLYPYGGQFTNVNGETRWLVERGKTYYMWRRMQNFSFVDPDIEAIPDVGPLSTFSTPTSSYTLEQFQEKITFFSEKSEKDVYVGDGDTNYEYQVFTDKSKKTPLKNCYVQITSDLSRQHIVDSQYTNEKGVTYWKLNKNQDYYVWRQHNSMKFQNPDVIHID